MMQKKCFLFVLLTLASAWSFSVSSSEMFSRQGYTSLTSLKALNHKAEGGIAADGRLDALDLRLGEMKKTAMTIGAQNGYIDRLNKLKSIINSKSNSYDSIFDFMTLMKLAGDSPQEDLYLLPPVITKTENLTMLSESATKMRISGQMYTITKPARLVTSAPNWRQYLLFDYPIEVSRPPSALLPKTAAEQRLWGEWVEQGWIQGIRQAEREMSYRARKLGQDFVGMTRYMVLASNGKVKKPLVVTTVRDVTGGGDEMRIDDRIIQLSVPARLNPNEGDWASLILDSRDSLRYEDELKHYNNN